MKTMNFKMDGYHMKRLTWIIRKRVSEELFEAPGMDLNVIAQEIASGLVILIRASVLGSHRSTRVIINAPDGRWQAFKYALGLPYRKRQHRLDAFALFPDLPANQKDCRVYLEAAPSSLKSEENVNGENPHPSLGLLQVDSGRS